MQCSGRAGVRLPLSTLGVVLALRGPVLKQTWLGERFIATENGWIDLATGRRAECVLHGVDVHEERAGPRAEAALTWTDGMRRLLDAGEEAAGAFEAWTAPAAAAAPAYVVRHHARRAAAAIGEHAESHAGAGIRTVALVTRPGAGTASVVADAARALRTLGFVTVCAEACVDDALREELCHRHVVIVDTPVSRARGETSRWIRDLTRVSRRAHLVLSIRMDRPLDLPAVVIEPCPVAELAASFEAGLWRPPGDVIDAAAESSEGWPHLFVRALDQARRSEDGRRGRVALHGPAAHALADSRLARATTLERRGRASAASRWRVAALEAARRRDDGSAAALAFERLAGGAHPLDWPQVLARATALLIAPFTSESHARIASAAGRLHLLAGDLCRAEALATQAEAEAALSGKQLPVAHAGFGRNFVCGRGSSMRECTIWRNGATRHLPSCALAVRMGARRAHPPGRAAAHRC